MLDAKPLTPAIGASVFLSPPANSSNFNMISCAAGMLGRRGMQD